MRLIVKIWACCLLLCGAVQAAEPVRNWQQIVDSGELRAGVAQFVPWTMVNKSGKLLGSEIDMGNRLAADMDVKIAFVTYEWEQLIPALQKGEIDIIIGGMVITPERARLINFSQPYAESGVGLVTNTKTTKKIDSLKGLNSSEIAIAVVSGTISADVAKRFFSQAAIKTFPTQDAAAKAVVDGLVHAYVASNPAPAFLALEHPDKVDMPMQEPLLATREAFAIRKGDHDFLAFLNAWIEARSADAWLPTTREYWFESLTWRALVEE